MVKNIRITKIEEASPATSHKKSRIKRITPFLVGAIFLIPLLLAWLLFMHTDEFEIKTTQKGTLIQPPILLSDFKFQTENNITLPIETFKGRWILLFVNGDICGRSCIGTLYSMNQIRLALGKNSNKVSNLFLSVSQKMNNPIIKMVQSQYSTIQFGTISQDEFANFSEKMPYELKPIAEGKLYIIDPRGYLIMGYAINTDPQALLKDLKKIVQG